jgi:hypothetical protein
MTPEEEFEKYWKSYGIPYPVGVLEGAFKEIAEKAYLAATKRIAQECVEICHNLGYAVGNEGAVAIAKRFLKGETR